MRNEASLKREQSGLWQALRLPARLGLWAMVASIPESLVVVKGVRLDFLRSKLGASFFVVVEDEISVAEN